MSWTTLSSKRATSPSAIDTVVAVDAASPVAVVTAAADASEPDDPPQAARSRRATVPAAAALAARRPDAGRTDEGAGRAGMPTVKRRRPRRTWPDAGNFP